MVVATRDRRTELLASLDRLCALPEAPEVVVVDNGSTDGTAEAVASSGLPVRVVRAGRNLGAVARTVGVLVTAAPVVAFADDDSWWDPGALAIAADALAAHPELGLVHGRILLEPGGGLERACAKMAAAPLGRPGGLPGPPILGHLACGVVVRRSAYLAVGGYDPLLFFGGEERLLSLDLAAAGWQQCYLEAAVARHRPSPSREGWPGRWARYRGNDILTSWMRLPLPDALAATGGLLSDTLREPAARRELPRVVRRLPHAWRARHPVPAEVVAALRASLGPLPPTAGAAAGVGTEAAPHTSPA